MRILIALACLGGFLATTSAWRNAHRERAEIESVKEGLPRLERDAEYVSSETCRACHPAEYDSWFRTYHRTMTQVAEPENVMGDFDGSTVTSHGLDYRVSREGGAFYANMPHPDEVMYVVQGGKPTPEPEAGPGEGGSGSEEMCFIEVVPAWMCPRAYAPMDHASMRR